MTPYAEFTAEQDRNRTLGQVTPERLTAYLDQISESAGLDAAREIALSHPAIFAAYCFGLRITEYQANLLWQAHNEKRLIILLPAAHGKSTLIGMVLLLYEVMRNRNIRICLMMKTDQTAKDYALMLQDVLNPALGQYPVLHRLFAPFKGNRWTTSEMNFVGRQISSDAPTIRFIGAKPSAVGKGCDWLIADDLVTDENSKTEAERRSLSGWFNNTAQSMPRSMWDRDLDTGWLRVPESIDWPRTPIDVDEEIRRLGWDLDGHRPPDEVVHELKLGKPDEYERITLCGTVFHVEDLWMEKAGDVEDLIHGILCQALDPTYKALYYDCFLDDAETIALWPEHRSIEWLKAERISMTEIEFNKRLRNRPINEANVALKMAWVKGGTYQGLHYKGCLDPEHQVGRYKENFVKVLGVDPASGRVTKRSSWCGFVLLAADPTTMAEDRDPEVWVVDAFRSKLGIDEILDVVFEGNSDRGEPLPGFYKQYAYDYCSIENNDKQVYLVDNRRVRAFNLKHPGAISGRETQKDKSDPVEGVRSLDVNFMNSRVHIPDARPSDSERMRRLVSELCRFPEGQVDLVMAFWVAMRKLRERFMSPESYYSEGYEEGPWIENPYWASEQPAQVPEAPKRRIVLPTDKRKAPEVRPQPLKPPAKQPIVVSFTNAEG
jgi:hypothetical protein